MEKKLEKNIGIFASLNVEQKDHKKSIEKIDQFFKSLHTNSANFPRFDLKTPPPEPEPPIVEEQVEIAVVKTQESLNKETQEIIKKAVEGSVYNNMEKFLNNNKAVEKLTLKLNDIQNNQKMLQMLVKNDKINAYDLAMLQQQQNQNQVTL